MMTILADISSGHTGFADIMFLVGFILFLLAAWFLSPKPPSDSVHGHAILALGLAAVALGWLVL